MRKIPSVLACVLLAVATQSQAQVYRAQNQLYVVPLNGGDFEVIEDHGEGARGIWCAAASFARYAQGTATDQRLYVKSPRGPSISGVGRIGVVFTTRADTLPVAPKQAYSVSVRDAGLGLPIHHAYQFCKDYLIELEDRF
ncbi:hypothetical protein SAMN04488523_10181 [Sulfitobacter brevis]|uniref:Invasion protein IalB, involved in pathogenesis n=1 Tax=Sulfitobacter brevis TaxID=74348 RepID=A0A1I1SLJ7_9RHOB|nr:hypothetical protein [Sulfitobacter brevis]SFD47349.1 hypothetical protein SAMN04488523_10181 [Sulfitobacter brevis]